MKQYLQKTSRLLLLAMVMCFFLPRVICGQSVLPSIYKVVIPSLSKGIRPDGEGTEEKPYLIGSRDHLDWISYTMITTRELNHKHFKLTNDIDVGSDWRTISKVTGEEQQGKDEPLILAGLPFLGVFDGNGYRISGLTDCLFSVIGTDDPYTIISPGPSAIIKNLGLEVSPKGMHPSFEETGYTGVLAMYTSNCLIQNSFVTGGTIYSKIKHPSPNIGGLVGGASSFTVISNCYTTNNIEITMEAEAPLREVTSGGIVGSGSFNTYVNNCFATGTISIDISKEELDIYDEPIRAKTYLGGIAGGGLSYVLNCVAANKGGLTINTDEPKHAHIKNIIGITFHEVLDDLGDSYYPYESYEYEPLPDDFGGPISGAENFYNNNYALPDIPKTSGVTTDKGVAGTDWNNTSIYPTGIFDIGQWLESDINPETGFPKLCYVGTKIALPSQMSSYDVDASTPANNGTFSVDKSKAKADEVVTITTVPDNDYAAALPTVTVPAGTLVTVTPVSTNQYTFTMPTSPVTVTATFLQLITVTVDDAIANGSIEVRKSDGTSLNPGTNAGIEENTELTITATPASGYKLKTLMADGSPITGYTHTVTADVSLSARFESIPVDDGGSDVDGGGDDDSPTTPTVYHTVHLPSVEGATTDPVAGEYEVEAWSSFRFYLSIDKEYDLSTPVVTTSRGETISPRTSDGAYIIQYVRQPVDILIDGITKNSDPVSNETVTTDAVKIWATKGNLHISTATNQTVQVYNLIGLLVKQADIPSGDTLWQLPSGIYIVRIDNRQYKIIL
ncbi:por secretion system C-terminal sorting domain-containing protein [Parabacteroides sp. HGS0025]|uniref:InlB B-repeat-containing protein n=1 Tax=Parabacteroides sp. HGS0025 TaxID=1078087 RepID=UPI0006173AF5|nr:DUF6383 domain-containing protein [Parabacteroides sp. HGS0025]KKB47791.1 por secretion system C-terminal sorting domain-containing protein [Parabacteroides sp. HGS0025]